MAGTVKAMNVMPNGTGIIGAPFYVNSRLLSTTAVTETPPTGANLVVFSCQVDFAVNYATTVGGASSSYGSTITDGSGSELNPTARHLAGVAEYSCIAPSSGILTLAYYKY